MLPLEIAIRECSAALIKHMTEHWKEHPNTSIYDVEVRFKVRTMDTHTPGGPGPTVGIRTVFLADAGWSGIVGLAAGLSGRELEYLDESVAVRQQTIITEKEAPNA